MDNRVFALVVLGVCLAPAALFAAWQFAGGSGPADGPVILAEPTTRDGATLEVHLGGDDGGGPPGIPKYAVGGAASVRATLCPRGDAALPASLPVRLWTLRDDGWRRADDVPVAAAGACREGALDAPVAALWPGRTGVVRWVVVAGPGSDVLPDPKEPAPSWRSAGLVVVDGEAIVARPE